MAQDNKALGFEPDSILQDIDNPGGQRALVGFVGKSRRDGFVRLYVTPSFDNYFEIEKQDILKTREIDKSVSPLGGSVVWVKNTAKIAQCRMRSFEVEAEYLNGRMAARIAQRKCCDDGERDDHGAVQAAGTTVFACGGSSWFLAAPDLPNPWTTGQCNSSSFGNSCTWTAAC